LKGKSDNNIKKNNKEGKKMTQKGEQIALSTKHFFFPPEILATDSSTFIHPSNSPFTRNSLYFRVFLLPQ